MGRRWSNVAIILLASLPGRPAAQAGELAIPDKAFGGVRRLERVEGESFFHSRCGTAAVAGGGACISPVYADGLGRRVSFHENQVTVQLVDGAGAADRLRILESIGARVIRETSVDGYLVLELAGGMDLQSALEILDRDAQVRFAEPRYLQEPRFSASLPDDPLAASAWHIHNAGGSPCHAAGADTGLLAAWDLTLGSPEVVIAILDSGMDLEHEDLQGRLYPRGDDDWNFAVAGSKIPADGQGHGTLVAGLAGATCGNGLGVCGVAPGCLLMPLKVDGLDFILNLVEALDYVVHFAGAHPELRIVLNGSLSTGSDFIAIHDGIARARRAGVVPFFATGNADSQVDYPARYDESIAVGATGPDDRRKRPFGCDGAGWGSNHGPEIDLVAPGVEVPSTDFRGPRGEAPGDYFTAFSGTSAASPIAAGIAALMLSVHPALTPDEVQGLLQVTAADRVGDAREDVPGFDPFMGWGRVDAARAVSAAISSRRFVRGDADLDGSLAAADARAALEFLFLGGPALSCPAAADFDDDGRIQINDPILLILRLFQGGRPPEPPFPEPGLDLTRDLLPPCR